MGLLDIEREPYVSEHAYFASAPNVAGMMTQDGRVILQPGLLGPARDSVKRNELARLMLQGHQPNSTLTERQQAMFSGTPYANDPANAMRSILARGISGDPSAQMSFGQDSELRKLRMLGGLLGGM